MRSRGLPKLEGTMRKVVLALLLVLSVGCVSPDPYRDLRTRDPVTTRATPWVIDSIAQFLSILARFLGPAESGRVIY